MTFYLGSHQTDFLEKAGVPLFVSRRRLHTRKRLPRAAAPWALDSGGFSELSMFGAWRLDARAYVVEVTRYAEEIGRLDWAACMDWMCEPFMLRRTGLTVTEHQQRTVASVVQLRDLAPALPWAPVLQGFRLDDYWRCWDRYDRAGIRLEEAPVVGLGSVCRRQRTEEVAQIVRSLQPLRLHAFGLKLSGLLKSAEALTSADSLAWSFQARKRPPLAGCTHGSCANCLRYALQWREEALRRIAWAHATPRQLCLAL